MYQLPLEIIPAGTTLMKFLYHLFKSMLFLFPAPLCQSLDTDKRGGVAEVPGSFIRFYMKTELLAQ